MAEQGRNSAGDDLNAVSPVGRTEGGAAEGNQRGASPGEGVTDPPPRAQARKGEGAAPIGGASLTEPDGPADS